MTNVKLIDVYYDTEEDVQFGTCELCFSVGSLTREFLIFKDDNGEKLEFELGHWSWGDYINDYYINNVIDFAHFINTKNVKSLDEMEERFDEIYNEYNDTPQGV